MVPLKNTAIQGEVVTYSTKSNNTIYEPNMENLIWFLYDILFYLTLIENMVTNLRNRTYFNKQFESEILFHLIIQFYSCAYRFTVHCIIVYGMFSNIQ